jgi:hypothetical protein
MSEQLPMVYVGPTSTKLGLQHYAHYSQLSSNVQDALEKHPSLRVLLMPLDQFHNTKQNVLGGEHSSVNHAIKQLQSDGVL